MRQRFQTRAISLSKKEIVEHVTLDKLLTSSRETINQVINEVAEAVSPKDGIKTMVVKGYRDDNQVDQWPMTQIANKTFKCEQLVLEKFDAHIVPVETRGAWLELVGAVCENSACLEELTVSNTPTTAEQGKDFLY